MTVNKIDPASQVNNVDDNASNPKSQCQYEVLVLNCTACTPPALDYLLLILLAIIIPGNNK
jgi:hypothetical protein